MKILAKILIGLCSIGILFNLSLAAILADIAPQMLPVWAACMLVFAIGIYFNLRYIEELDKRKKR